MTRPPHGPRRRAAGGGGAPGASPGASQVASSSRPRRTRKLQPAWHTGTWLAAARTRSLPLTPGACVRAPLVYTSAGHQPPVRSLLVALLSPPPRPPTHLSLSKNPTPSTPYNPSKQTRTCSAPQTHRQAPFSPPSTHSTQTPSFTLVPSFPPLRIDGAACNPKPPAATIGLFPRALDLSPISGVLRLLLGKEGLPASRVDVPSPGSKEKQRSRTLPCCVTYPRGGIFVFTHSNYRWRHKTPEI